MYCILKKLKIYYVIIFIMRMSAWRIKENQRCINLKFARFFNRNICYLETCKLKATTFDLQKHFLHFEKQKLILITCLS